MRHRTALLAGATLVVAGWQPGSPVLAPALLPFAWALAPRPTTAGCLFFAYYLVGTRALPGAALRLYGAWPGLPLGVSLWVVLALAAALPWVALHPDMEASRPSIVGRLLAASALSLLPPLGLCAWLQPVHCAGWLFPGAGWAGLLGTLVLEAWLALGGRRWGEGRRAEALPPLIAFGLLCAQALQGGYPLIEPPPGWLAVGTVAEPFPAQLPTTLQQSRRLLGLARRGLREGAKVVVLPELAAGRWSPLLATAWEADLRRHTRSGATVLVGAAVEVGEGAGFRNSLLALDSSGWREFPARQPLPLVLWRPLGEPLAQADWQRPGVRRIGAERALVLICYEEFLPALILRDFFLDPPSLMLTVADSRWSGDSDAARSQALHSRGWALLFGIPMLRAVNGNREAPSGCRSRHWSGNC